MISYDGRMRQESYIVDGYPAWRESCTMERQKSKVLHITLYTCWIISIAYEAIDQGSLQNPVAKWTPIASEYKLGFKIGSILVSHSHTLLVLVVGINNDWYIKHFLAFCQEKCGICSTCIGTFIAWTLSHYRHL